MFRGLFLLGSKVLRSLGFRRLFLFVGGGEGLSVLLVRGGLGFRGIGEDLRLLGFRMVNVGS